ncbi:sugar phosphate isomerase/epimerase family protein [Arthrobacter sp. SD76]|uniref:sugar phosphate isomerase/epimerase family protein n=1 Tax=Arthrobacter sp. SD76 TaxID=3415007 RepID=UPI003C74B693
MVAALRRLAAYAVARGVRLMLENDDVITADPAKLIPILDALGPEVGLVLDTGNIEPVMSEVSRSFIAGEEPNDVADPEPTYSVIEMLLPRAEVVHVKTYGFKEDGSSTVYDLKRVLQILVDGNFTGPVTIEYAGHDAAAADRVIQRTIDLIRAA